MIALVGLLSVTASGVLFFVRVMPPPTASVTGAQLFGAWCSDRGDRLRLLRAALHDPGSG